MQWQGPIRSAETLLPTPGGTNGAYQCQFTRRIPVSSSEFCSKQRRAFSNKCTSAAEIFDFKVKLLDYDLRSRNEFLPYVRQNWREFQRPAGRERLAIHAWNQVLGPTSTPSAEMCEQPGGIVLSGLW